MPSDSGTTLLNDAGEVALDEDGKEVMSTGTNDCILCCYIEAIVCPDSPGGTMPRVFVSRKQLQSMGITTTKRFLWTPPSGVSWCYTIDPTRAGIPEVPDGAYLVSMTGRTLMPSCDYALYRVVNSLAGRTTGDACSMAGCTSYDFINDVLTLIGLGPRVQVTRTVKVDGTTVDTSTSTLVRGYPATPSGGTINNPNCFIDIASSVPDYDFGTFDSGHSFESIYGTGDSCGPVELVENSSMILNLGCAPICVTFNSVNYNVDVGDSITLDHNSGITAFSVATGVCP